jgi:hypothetical protein
MIEADTNRQRRVPGSEELPDERPRARSGAEVTLPSWQATLLT